LHLDNLDVILCVSETLMYEMHITGRWHFNIKV
jgi:hypothetical protein